MLFSRNSHHRIYKLFRRYISSSAEFAVFFSFISSSPTPFLITLAQAPNTPRHQSQQNHPQSTQLERFHRPTSSKRWPPILVPFKHGPDCNLLVKAENQAYLSMRARFWCRACIRRLLTRRWIQL